LATRLAPDRLRDHADGVLRLDETQWHGAWHATGVTGRNPGRYESRYLRAVDPARPRGVWIRHTTHQRPGEAPTGALWCTVWDAEAGPPYAVKQRLPGPPPRRFVARAEAQGRAAAWDLSAAGEGRPLRHLPRAWMYRAPLPRTKPQSPLPDAVFTGWIEAGGRRTEVAGGRRTEVAGWRGMVGHNWGAEHAERWVWLHGLGFAEAPGAWIDVVLGRVRVGGRLTPWVANGALSLDGRRYRLGGLRRAEVDAGVGAFAGVLGGRGASVTVRVVSPEGQTVAYRYADPSGGEHVALNCSIAEMHLRVERPGRPALELATAFGAAYELGVRDAPEGVAVEPFPDP
jgi:hypothetical protein